MRTFCRSRQPDLATRQGLVQFVAGAVVLGPLAGGLIGATVNWLNAGGSWPEMVVQWWAGDGIAVLVVGGPILLWAQRRALVASRWPELAGVVLLTAGLSVGRTYVAVGDLVGHGVAAAEDMTQLRNAGRALAIEGHGPASLLRELAEVTTWATSGKFATMAAAIVEPDASLVERRGDDILAGISRVAEELQAWRSGTPLEDLCGHVVRSVAPEPQLDDVCVLAVGRPRRPEGPDPAART